MIDLVNKAKGLKTVVVEKKANPKPARMLFSETTIKILECIKRRPGIGSTEIAKITDISKPHACTLLARLIRAGLLSRESCTGETNRMYVYTVGITRDAYYYLIEKEKLRLKGPSMGPMDKKVLSAIKNIGTCRISQVAEAIESYNEYVSVYIRRLISKGLVIRNRIEGVLGIQYEYTINSEMVAA